uniref:Endopeptidase n=1 Tax=Kwoniella dejecticola CBS 10117 TaxID=1296121 RepID=A0A1A6AGU3_9TREE|nr:endopeptidase [Kwoniella dejecticola CBS 10117]OBR89228.1 endopeptidase [Kwoniella dejecticola CBS 10117]
MLSHLFVLFSLLPLLAFTAPLQPEPLHRLPLRKIPTARDGEHPVLAFERHQKAAIKRMHQFKLAPPPSEEEFQARNLERRRFVESNPKRLDKRLYIPDAPLPSIPQRRRDEAKRAWWRPTDTAASAPSATSSTTGGAVPHVAAKGNSTTGDGAAAAAEATVKASGSNANGFSEVALQASQDVSLTNSDSELVQGGLDYIIEANDIGYLCEIQIGTPAQTFLMLMDTGSADTWVPSTSCGLQNCGDHTALGADNSDTFQASQQQFQVTYGSGAVAGVLAADTMTIAGMTLVNHAMGVTLQESVQFSAENVPFDGLMGLALSVGLIKSPILGIALGRLTDGENNGELVFGQADTAKIDASTTQTLQVSSNDGFWQVEMGAVTVDGVQAVGARQAILDTGNLMIAPPADVGGGMFSIPCMIDQEVTMTFGNVAFQIDVRDLLFQPLSNDLTGDCLSSLSAGTIKDDVTWLLGDSFLKNVYMTTNADDLTVQLSARTDVEGSSSASAGQMGVSANAINGTSTSTSTSNAAIQSDSATSASSGGVTPSNSAALSVISALAALLAGGSNL